MSVQGQPGNLLKCDPSGFETESCGHPRRADWGDIHSKGCTRSRSHSNRDSPEIRRLRVLAIEPIGWGWWKGMSAPVKPDFGSGFELEAALALDRYNDRYCTH